MKTITISRIHLILKHNKLPSDASMRNEKKRKRGKALVEITSETMGELKSMYSDATAHMPSLLHVFNIKLMVLKEDKGCMMG